MMNEIVNKFLLAGEKFMPEMHLKSLLHLIRTHLQCLWTTHEKQERIQEFKETGNSRYIYKNEPDKACY